MKIGVIMGGISSEREVSLKTGQEMINHLDRSRYEAVPIVVTQRADLITQAQQAGIDFALLALHGQYGEDGTVQGALETLGIPYTGSGVLASSLCMNKQLSKMLLKTAGIQTPAGLYWKDVYDPQAVEQLGYPVIVKPNLGGSSIGVQLVQNEKELLSAVQEASYLDQGILIEPYLKGTELTCAILDGEVLPIIGIRSAHSEWFDYRAKYEDGGAEEKVIELPPVIQQRVREAALASYQLLQCKVYARVDMILSQDIPYVLEVNTLPGMTANSLFPKSAAAAGMTFTHLLDRIITSSLYERKREWGSPVNG
ncbi:MULTISPECIES: D-alanine--D-alanine ligase [Brevibacillus]|uniref:D-alanine--D-alanine ligase n=1 Tax=Brevibacillus TaxID=55080 RepID=UPI000D0FEBF3|nr:MULTISPECIES: D-alanine--D-alanine ligase [Brevibacillus]MED1943991.1 D-alanine--D-alanine ligase [Brevibacillus formosus]MED1999637.1 D-alanine--D-alanine ligase [Brevibacillus formosus]MED2082226.1 D-alanine--D-alanine ligase [Brevibacillus formosus]PSK18853.1 D-alanine--D-alanine ligase [Brevibacillus sp. NRRL NRS-603]